MTTATSKPRTLITGVDGQIGSELFDYFRNKDGAGQVVGLDLRPPRKPDWQQHGHFEVMDATIRDNLESVIKKYNIRTIYHLVGILSAKGELDPNLAWHVNMQSLKHVLDLAAEYNIRVFWPSSIAVFGPTTPRDNTPQETVLEPRTMYGVTKVAGELLCNYYFHHFNVDVRSLRFPGIISYKTPPGGGTTDYAVEIFHAALQHQHYTCFVSPETTLPMMYMDDAIKSIIDLMHAPAEKLSIRTSYNLTGISFAARELETEIRKHIPSFHCSYEPDYRQSIADTWPIRIDDSRAREDWGWQHQYDLAGITEAMLSNLREYYEQQHSH